MILEIHYIQPRDDRGGFKATLWNCPETGHAGRLYLIDKATPEIVARNIHRSYPGGFLRIREAMQDALGEPVTITINVITGEVYDPETESFGTDSDAYDNQWCDPSVAAE